jgi:hypothetical protein
VLAYFRSHHDNQSWLGALTAILDACAFVISSLEGPCERQAQLTFAITRHTIVDLSQIFGCPPCEPEQDRLSPSALDSLRTTLTSAGLKLRIGSEIDQKLSELRRLYEPYTLSLSHYLHVSLPPWIPQPGSLDSWQTTTWGGSTGFQVDGLTEKHHDGHF